DGFGAVRDVVYGSVVAAGGRGVHVVTTRGEYKGRVYEAHLLRRTYREGGKVRNETLANLSRLPRETIELVRRSLRGEQFLSAAEGVRGRALAAARPRRGRVGARAPARAFPPARPRPSKQRDRVLTMICQRVLAPGSKLACARQLAQSTLAEELGV